MMNSIVHGHKRSKIIRSSRWVSILVVKDFHQIDINHSFNHIDLSNIKIDQYQRDKIC